MFGIKKIKQLCKQLIFYFCAFFPETLYHLDTVIINCSAVTEVAVCTIHIGGTFERELKSW